MSRDDLSNPLSTASCDKSSSARSWTSNRSCIAQLVCLVVIALIFGGAGVLKVIGEPTMVQRLADLGFGTPWRLFIGITELLGVLAITVCRLRPLALICLWPYAIGGLALHISHGHDLARMAPAIAGSLVIPTYFMLRARTACKRSPA